MDQRTIRFGPFDVDPGAGQLRGPAGPIPLQDLPFKFLLALLERPRAVVTRDELRQRLWGDTIIDFDGGLNTAARKLRDALGDSADRPVFFETIPRRGYRLLVAVEHAETSNTHTPLETGDGAANAPVFRFARMNQVQWAATAALLLLAAIATSMLIVARPARIRLLVVPIAGAAETQPLADELTDEVIGHVGRLAPHRLEVFGPITSRAYRGSTDSIERMGRDVGATHVFSGRILDEGGRVRLTGHVARVSDGVQVWSDIIEPTGGTLPHIASVLVTSIARGVAQGFSLGWSEAVPRAGTLSAAAFDAYLKGRSQWNRFDSAGFRASRASFEEAVRIDPEFVDGYVGIADASAMLALVGEPGASRSLSDATAAANTAVLRAPEHAGAHAALATSLFYSLTDWPRAETEFRRATELDPGSALFQQWAAAYYAARGDHAQALTFATRARDLDPQSPGANIDLCWYYFYARDFRGAADQSARTARITRSPANLVCGELAFRQMGDQRREADAYLARLRLFAPTQDVVASARAALADSGIDGLRRHQLSRLRTIGSSANPYVFATTAMALGEHALALETLKRSAADRRAWWPFMRVDPTFDALSGQAEFVKLLDSVGLPPLRTS